MTTFYHIPINKDLGIYELDGDSHHYEILPTFTRLFGYLMLTYAVSLLRDNSKLYLIWISLIITSLMVSIFCILEYYFGINFFTKDLYPLYMEGRIEFRVRGPFGDPNASAGMISPGMIVLIVNFFFTKKKLLFSLPLIVFLFLGMASTSSRSALVALMVPLSMYLFLGRHAMTLKKKILISIIASLIMSFVIDFYLRDRGLSFDSDASSKVRISLLLFAFDLMITSPILGYGFNGGFHNIFSDIGVSGGIPLLLMFNTILLLVFNKLWTHRNNMNAFLIMSLLLNFLMLGLGISITLNVIFWVFLGLAMNPNFYTRKQEYKIDKK